LAAAAIAVVLLATAGTVYLIRTNKSSVTSVAAPIDSIAVLPFQNKSGDAETEYLSDGLAESLIFGLSQLPKLKVSPTSSVFRYRGKEIDPIKIGNDLSVNAVMTGRLSQHGNELTISVELVDVRLNKLLLGKQYDRKLG
jgi:TolB-like protein